MMCPLSLSALTYTKADSLKVVQLLDAGKKQTRGTDLTLFFAEQFIDLCRIGFAASRFHDLTDK